MFTIGILAATVLQGLQICQVKCIIYTECELDLSHLS